jgi:hypothetical protein
MSMFHSFQSLPVEILLRIAFFLDQPDRLSFAQVENVRIMVVGERSLFEYPEILSYGCNHPSNIVTAAHNANGIWYHLCHARVFKYLKRAFSTRWRPLTLALRKTLAQEPSLHSLPLDLQTHNDTALQDTFATIDDMVRLALPVRNAAGDWLDDLEQSSFLIMSAAVLVYGENLVELRIESVRPDGTDIWPLLVVLDDIQNNTIGGQVPSTLAQLRRLEVAFGGVPGFAPFLGMHPGDLSLLPSLREACFGYGVPVFTQHHLHLEVLRIRAQQLGTQLKRETIY